MTQTGPCPDGPLAQVTILAEGDPQAAHAEVERLCSAYPDDGRLYFLLGSLAAGLRHYGDARRAMERAIALAPAFTLARFQLGLLLLTSGEAAAADDMLRPLLTLAEQDPLRLFATGLLHLIRDEFTLATQALEEGIRHNHANAPLNHDMRMLIAEIDARADSIDEATDIPHSAAHALLHQSALKATKH